MVEDSPAGHVADIPWDTGRPGALQTSFEVNSVGSSWMRSRTCRESALKSVLGAGGSAGAGTVTETDKASLVCYGLVTSGFRFCRCVPRLWHVYTRRCTSWRRNDEWVSPNAFACEAMPSSHQNAFACEAMPWSHQNSRPRRFLCRQPQVPRRRRRSRLCLLSFLNVHRICEFLHEEGEAYSSFCGRRRCNAVPAVPAAFFLDWPSLSTKKVPGFLPRKPAPWMHPEDVTAAVVSPSWVNIDDGPALEAAARCSNLWKPDTKRDERTVSTKGAAAEGSEPCSAGNGKTAGIAQVPPGAGGRLDAWDERLEKQKDAGTLHYISVRQFTPVREKDSGMPLNPILFTGSVTPSCAGDLHGEKRPATFKRQNMNQQELPLQQLQGQRQKSEGCRVTSFPQVHVRGRGILGKWGPNRTADAVVTAVNPVTDKLQVVLIRRTDGTGQYAFPGGFADDTDFPPFVSTAVREFLEEAVHFGDGAAAGTGRTAEAEVPASKASTEDDGDKRAVAPSAALSGRTANTVEAPELRTEEGYGWQREESLEALKEVFGKFTWDVASGKLFWGNEHHIRPGTVIYAGYVDDARNTDNAWIETIAFHWHVAPSLYSRVHLRAGDDAAEGSASFYDIRDDPRLIAENVDPLKDLYSSHSGILRKTLKQQFPDFK